MELSYTYKKLRRRFGVQCIFNTDATDLCQIDPDDELKKQFKRNKTADVSIQNVQQMAVVEVATDHANMCHSGLYHWEGGWPNDIDLNDDAAKVKHLKTHEHTKQYEEQLKMMCMKMEHKIAQNNAVNLFQEYFVDEKSTHSSYKPQIEGISIFESPFKLKDFNGIASHSSISPTSNDKMVVSYTSLLDGQMSVYNHGMPSFIWNLNRNLKPILTLECPDPLSLSTVEYNVKDESMIAAGRSDGTVALYDCRLGGKATAESIREESHREYVSSLQWTMSKGNVEFFTCANDACFITWDIRNMEQPFDKVQLKLNGAGCSSSDYLFTMPTRFLIGTTNGLIISGNRRGKTYEERFAYSMKSFAGPVKTVERNPFADKYSLCIGDQSIRFWSDENRETPIMHTIDYSDDLTCGTWNRNRCSNFLIGHENGTIDMWDLLHDQYRPIASTSIVNSRVQHLRSHSNGKLFCSCHENGDVHLLQISDFLAAHKIIEKAKLIEIFEREMRREILFLTKIRELRMQIGGKADESTDADDSNKLDPETLMNECIADFDKILQKETK